MRTTPIQELIDSVEYMAQELLNADELYDYFMEKATQMLEKEAMAHDKILSMTNEFVQSNRGKGQIFADYHYDMMADFALHILETFKTKER